MSRRSSSDWSQVFTLRSSSAGCSTRMRSKYASMGFELLGELPPRKIGDAVTFSPFGSSIFTVQCPASSV